MGVLKTSVGIFTGSVAIDAFKAASHADKLSDNLALKGIGSVAASISFHTLKDEAIDVVKESQQIGTRKQKAIPMKD